MDMIGSECGREATELVFSRNISDIYIYMQICVASYYSSCCVIITHCYNKCLHLYSVLLRGRDLLPRGRDLLPQGDNLLLLDDNHHLYIQQRIAISIAAP